jgi:hypothetical protein
LGAQIRQNPSPGRFLDLWEGTSTSNHEVTRSLEGSQGLLLGLSGTDTTLLGALAGFVLSIKKMKKLELVKRVNDTDVENDVTQIKKTNDDD